MMIESGECWIPPEWALLQRKIIDLLDFAAVEFVERYTRPDGTLVWKKHWPGMDGSDDPYEGFMNFPLFYMLGGSKHVHQESRRIYDAITWQWAQYGQIYREYDAYYDWMHHGESNLMIYFFGLADPSVMKDRQRSLFFADLFTGYDGEADNYDRELKLMRSPIQGSRGPRFEQTWEDWSTHREVLDNYPPPFEDIPDVPGPKCPWTDDHVYEEILLRIKERMAKGDVPLNLTSTALAAHAFMYAGREQHYDFVIEYLHAWKERTIANEGIMPDNVGLSGMTGEHMDGKWWGGYYGWRWPHGAFTIIEPSIIAGSSAVLLTGEDSHLDLARSQLDMLWEKRKWVDDHWVVPHKHMDAGWTDYRPLNPQYPLYCWLISMKEADRERLERHYEQGSAVEPTEQVGKGFIGNALPWYEYVSGRSPEYPEKILRINYKLILRQLKRLRLDQGDPATWDIHHWQLHTPMVLEGMVQTMLGAPMHIYHGGLLHAQLRYFDGLSRRPGLPPSVGGLVEKVHADYIMVSLVNLDEHHSKEIVMQAGTFGEHQWIDAEILNNAGQRIGQRKIDHKFVSVRLKPSAGIQLKLFVQRYTNRPTYDTPWFTAKNDVEEIVPRFSQDS